MKTDRVLQVIERAVNNADKRGIRVEVRLDSHMFGVLTDRVIVTVEKRNGMGTPSSPSRYDPLHKLQPNEPYFVLRAQDRYFPKVVQGWAANVMNDPHATAASKQKAAEAFEVAARGQAWQALHGCKVPD